MKKRITINFSTDAIRIAKQLAKQDRRSMSGILEQLVVKEGAREKAKAKEHVT